jgi:PAS domain S-box-containing protein
MNDLDLKSLCKDEASFEQLKSHLSTLEGEKDKLQENLRLLEEAIKGDYDSILITELDLEKPGPRIVYVNDGFTRMTGYKREEVIGKTPRILQGPKTDRATLDRLKRCLIEGKSFFGQAVNYRKDGSEFINQWDIHPIYNKEGDITHWVSYQHDISARKKAELTFLENDVEFDELYEYSKRTLVDINRKGELVMANKSL